MRYVDRDGFILQFCRGKRVLHLGCVGLTDLPSEERVLRFPETLHWRLSQVARVIGVDNSANVVARLRESDLAANIVVGDVQALEEIEALRPEFDVILAADIIEHVSNPGRLLDGIHRLCRADTDVLLTTPNAFGLFNFIRFMAHRFGEGREHVMAFNFYNLANLLRRHGFEPIELGTCHQRSRHLPPGLFVLGAFLLSRLPRLGGTIFVQAIAGREQMSRPPADR
jgi:2-polyprenyl-3-methyl-5-hydroxy-6-metoxy-1,4-benzoquinol methylase